MRFLNQVNDINESHYLYYNFVEYEPIDEITNIPQINPNLNYYINLFDKSTSRYIGTSAEKWAQSFDSIKAILSSKRFKTKNIYVGVLKEEGISPPLQLIENCIGRTPSGNWNRMFLNIAFKSDDESKGFLYNEAFD